MSATLVRALWLSAGLHAAALGAAWGGGWMDATPTPEIPKSWTATWIPAPDLPEAREAPPGDQAPAPSLPAEDPDEGPAWPVPPPAAPLPGEGLLQEVLPESPAGTPPGSPSPASLPGDAVPARTTPPPASPLPTPPGKAPAPARGVPDSACPRPPYPEEAEARGIEGTATVRVRVGADGRVSQVELTGSSGSPVLDRAVLDWIPRRWGPFQPMRDAEGRPVPGQSFERRIRFTLSE